MNITIISVGKVREKYLKLGIEEFSKRLQAYCKLTFHEIPDEQAPENLSEKQLNDIKNKEGSKVLAKIKDNQYVIALDVLGSSLSSEQLAKEIENLTINGNSTIIFVIGGSNGLSEDVLKRANKKLSFSKMTFPHQLMKLILLEQVYRGFKIMKNEPYHK